MIIAMSPFMSGLLVGILATLALETLLAILFIRIVPPSKDDDNPFDRTSDRSNKLTN